MLLNAERLPRDQRLWPPAFDLSVSASLYLILLKPIFPSPKITKLLVLQSLLSTAMMLSPFLLATFVSLLSYTAIAEANSTQPYLAPLHDLGGPNKIPNGYLIVLYVTLPPHSDQDLSAYLRSLAIVATPSTTIGARLVRICPPYLTSATGNFSLPTLLSWYGCQLIS